MSEPLPVVIDNNEENASRACCHVMYLLHAVSAASGVLGSATIVGSFIFGVPSIVAVILNYLTRGRVRGTWLESHWRWQLRTFWFAVAWMALAGVLAITLIGLPVTFLLIVGTGIWVLYRVIRGWLALFERRSVLMPRIAGHNS